MVQDTKVHRVQDPGQPNSRFSGYISEEHSIGVGPVLGSWWSRDRSEAVSLGHV